MNQNLSLLKMLSKLESKYSNTHYDAELMFELRSKIQELENMCGNVTFYSASGLLDTLREK